MHHISKATAVITYPARTALAVASAGVRTTVRLAGWAAEQAVGRATGTGTGTPTVTVPDPRPAAADAVDPMEPTRTAPPAARTTPPRKAPAKKVPASQVPLKSAPTPSLPAGVEELDAALDASEPAPQPPAAKKAPAKKTAAKKAPAKKTAAKKAPAKKTAAKKAPSAQAAVLAPALGLSEDEVAEVVEGGNDQA